MRTHKVVHCILKVYCSLVHSPVLGVGQGLPDQPSIVLAHRQVITFDYRSVDHLSVGTGFEHVLYLGMSPIYRLAVYRHKASVPTFLVNLTIEKTFSWDPPGAGSPATCEFLCRLICSEDLNYGLRVSPQLVARKQHLVCGEPARNLG